MLNKALSFSKLVFSKAPDTSTLTGRRQDRFRRAAWTSMTSILVRGVNITTNFVTVPLTLTYLGEDSFGLWMALTSFMLFLTFADLGFGVGLQNALADCYGRGDNVSPSHYISSGLFVMSVVFVMFVAVAIFVIPNVDLRVLFTINNEETASQLQQTVQAVLIAFGFGLPIGLIQRIYNAYQKGYWGYLQLAAGSLLGFGGILMCIYFRLGLPILAFIFTGARFTIPMCGGVIMFIKQSWLRPSFRKVRLSYIKQIFSTGVTAMGAQFAAMLLVGGIPIVIANRFSVSSVTSVSLVQKLISVVLMVFSMAIWSLWPAYSEAAARKDWFWVSRTFKRTLVLNALVLFPSFLLITLIGQWIIKTWTGKPEVVPTLSLLMAWNVWMLFKGYNTACRILLGGLNHMLGQTLYGSALGLAALASVYILSSNIGLDNAIWVGIIIGEVLLCICMNIEVVMVIRKHQK